MATNQRPSTKNQNQNHSEHSQNKIRIQKKKVARAGVYHGDSVRGLPYTLISPDPLRPGGHNGEQAKRVTEDDEEWQRLVKSYQMGQVSETPMDRNRRLVLGMSNPTARSPGLRSILCVAQPSQYANHPSLGARVGGGDPKNAGGGSWTAFYWLFEGR